MKNKNYSWGRSLWQNVFRASRIDRVVFRCQGWIILKKANHPRYYITKPGGMVGYAAYTIKEALERARVKQ